MILELLNKVFPFILFTENISAFDISCYYANNNWFMNISSLSDTIFLINSNTNLFHEAITLQDRFPYDKKRILIKIYCKLLI